MTAMLEPKAPQEKKDLDTLLAEAGVLVLEMEGVLTDGAALVGPDGAESLSVHGADARALAVWRQAGGKLVVVAREDLPAARAWCEAREIAFRTHQGRKAPMLQALLFELQAMPNDVCYAGADLDDLPAMLIAGVTAAPADAHLWAREAAAVQLSRPGGRGAARELVDLLLDKRPPVEG
jgi:3-deoxy-D-manno-octulosonate 8-phosphate phosphatase KdsC-like HAD superfamily phosphatase